MAFDERAPIDNRGGAFPAGLGNRLTGYLDEQGYENPLGRSCLISIATRVVNTGVMTTEALYEYLLINGLDAFMSAYALDGELPSTLRARPARTNSEPAAENRRRTDAGFPAIPASTRGELLDNLKAMRDNIFEELEKGRETKVTK